MTLLRPPHHVLLFDLEDSAKLAVACRSTSSRTPGRDLLLANARIIVPDRHLSPAKGGMGQ